MAARKTDREIPKVTLNRENLKKSVRLFRYMSKPNRGLFALGTLFLAISAGASILFPKLLGNMMDGVFVYKDGGVTTAPSTERIQEIAGYFVILFAVQAVFSFLRISLYVRVTEDMTKGLRTDLFESVVSQNMHFLEKTERAKSSVASAPTLPKSKIHSPPISPSSSDKYWL